jgi:hypothetical protein
LWRGAKETTTFYRFWRVRLVLHVTAKGIYIPGFCTSTYIHIYIHSYIHSYFILNLYLLLHLIIVHIHCRFYNSASISWFTCACFSSLLLLLRYIYICVCWLLYCLVSWYRSCRVFFWLWSAPLQYAIEDNTKSWNLFPLTLRTL